MGDVDRYIRWGDLKPGQSLQPFVWRIAEAEVGSYVRAVEDEAISRVKDDGALAPPMLAAVYCLRSFVSGNTELAPGGVHLRQQFQFLEPIHAGDTLTTVATVEQCRPRGDKIWVGLSTRTVNQSGRTVSTSRFTGVWPRETEAQGSAY